MIMNNNSSGQSIIDKINDNHKFWEENIKEEYLDVINGYYNLLMFRIDYDSSSTSKTEVSLDGHASEKTDLEG